ncbi:hypothetical protein J6590_056994 [Homalodisca vitripennis]|nr:hypothetical protein J6590_056994 [Homalodisca vitripennis]
MVFNNRPDVKRLIGAAKTSYKNSGKQQGPMHKCITRHASDYYLPRHSLIATEKSSSYAGAKMWNALPEDLKMTDRKHFRQTLKNWLLDQPFYSLNKFYGRRT